MSKRWNWKDLKSKGIFINQDGVGKVLAPPIKKKVTEQDIQKVLAKLKKKNERNKM